MRGSVAFVVVNQTVYGDNPALVMNKNCETFRKDLQFRKFLVAMLLPQSMKRNVVELEICWLSESHLVTTPGARNQAEKQKLLK